MKTIRTTLCHRLSDESLDSRLGQLACYLGAVAVVPTSIVALVRHPGSRVEFLFGLGLACLVGVLCATLGTLCRRVMGSHDRLSIRSRWPEFASGAAGFGLLIIGIWWISGLGLSPAQVTLGLLLTGSLSLTVLVLGMMSTLVRASKG